MEGGTYLQIRVVTAMSGDAGRLGQILEDGVGRATVRAAHRSAPGESDSEFLRVMHTHYHVMQRVACRYEADRRDVEEILADAMELAYRHLETLSSANDVQARSWLVRTVRFLSINHIRKSMTRRRAVERFEREPLPIFASPEEEYLAFEDDAVIESTRADVRRVLDELSVTYRTALAMSATGASGDVIGETLGVSAGAARKILQRARAAFRARWLSTVAERDGNSERRSQPPSW